MKTIIEHELFHKFCSALIILVVGILAIRIVGNILKKALEKSRLEKAAHVLIPLWPRQPCISCWV